MTVAATMEIRMAKNSRIRKMRLVKAPAFL
jgi:hypothetical protein